MNKLKKAVLEVKVGDAFVCTKTSDYFTKGRVHKVQSSEYDAGSLKTEIEFLDNDYDLHAVTEEFLNTNFKKQ